MMPRFLALLTILLLSGVHSTALAGSYSDEELQKVRSHFPELMDSYDKLNLISGDLGRKDVMERAEEEFDQVVAAVNRGEVKRAIAKVRHAKSTLHSAFVLAMREKYSKPVSMAISKARKVNAVKFAPDELNEAVAAKSRIEQIIKSKPEEQQQIYKLSKQGVEAATFARKVGLLGEILVKDPGQLGKWVNDQYLVLAPIAENLDYQLKRINPVGEQVAAMNQLITGKGSLIEAQVTDAEGQVTEMAAYVAELQEKLKQYEGEISQYKSDVAELGEVRNRLKAKREQQAKIEALSTHFSDDKVEVVYTDKSNVLLRMKKMDFQSGSAVVSPNAFEYLDLVSDVAKNFPGWRVRVEGHTDSSGSTALNQELSLRRAGAVKGYLSELNSSLAIDVEGIGEASPIASNDDLDGRKLNRRIDIVFINPNS